MSSRNGIADSRWFLEHGFLAFLDEYHIEDADDLAALDIVEGATAVAGVSGSIELKNGEGAAA